jgi:chromosome segregation ATPase
LEASLSERQTLQNEYEANLEKLHRQDEVESKSNLELLDNIQAQVKILAEKLTLDDNQIASLRQSLKEKKEQVSDLEYGKRGRNFMNT